MSAYLSVFACIFGLVLGSFLNALTFRYNTGQPLWKAIQGRSHCMRCIHVLRAFDLIPIFSYVLLSGRCRYCRSSISLQYPLVEAVAAALSLMVYMQFPQPVPYAFWLLVWMTILFLVVYDWRHLILPLEALLLLIMLTLIPLFFPCVSTAVLRVPYGTVGLGLGPFGAHCSLVLPTLVQFFEGPILAAPLLFLSLISLGRWMGWGDGILALALGWMLGVSQGFSALILAFWIGAIVGLLLILMKRISAYIPRIAGGGRRTFSLLALVLPRSTLGRTLTLKSELPFGPFLALGAALIFFIQFDLFKMLGIGL